MSTIQPPITACREQTHISGDVWYKSGNRFADYPNLSYQSLMVRYYRRTLVKFALRGFVAPLVFLLAPAAISAAQDRQLTIDDVLAIETVDRADISPASKEIAIAVLRPAGPGEVYGRNAYEIDPSRSDIWLIDREGGSTRRLTDGSERAAGYWCPYWSPDGQRLAMLSTAPEREEPHGGDNVRLYVWERGEEAPRRLSDRAAVAQSLYGSPLNQLDLRAAGSRRASSCRENNENAPFLWLDAERLLVMLMPPGERSAMVDRYAGFYRSVAEQGAAIRWGEVPTVSRSESGPQVHPHAGDYHAELVIFDLADNSQTVVGRIPAFPMFGATTLAVSPDSRSAAILAPVRAIAPHLLSPENPNIEAWFVENALFLADLDEADSIQAISLPDPARLPLDIIDWSSDASHVALRARADGQSRRPSLWTVDAESGETVALAPDLAVGGDTPSYWSEPNYAFWVDGSHMLVSGTKPGAATEWRLIDSRDGNSAVLSQEFIGVRELHALASGALVGRNNEGLVRFDTVHARFEPWFGPRTENCSDDGPLVSRRTATGVQVSWLATGGADATSVAVPNGARILDHDCTGVVWLLDDYNGSTVTFANWSGRQAEHQLLQRNVHLAEIDWGERRIIAYTHANGSAQQMAVLFPPDYDPQQSYPTLFWVYGGYSVTSTDGYFLNPQMPGFYNLQLYASRGYVVVVPSIPIERGTQPSEHFAEIPGGVLPALDLLVAEGITHEERVGVFGQSFGGYSTSALIAQSDRFSAAVVIAGATDLATNYGAFDPAARAWPGVEQDMDANESIYQAGLGFVFDPGTNPELYRRNSPLTYANQITTPLLLIHGELDARAPLNQPVALYSLLRRRGQSARLLQYWGENHSLANSPANVRDINAEILSWFDLHLKQYGENM